MCNYIFWRFCYYIDISIIGVLYVCVKVYIYIKSFKYKVKGIFCLRKVSMLGELL